MSEISGHFPEVPNSDVLPINDAMLNAKVSSTIRHDLELLATAGVRNPVCFGRALRDFDCGMTPNDYNFIGGLPGDSFIQGVCRVVGRLSRDIADEEITTVTNRDTQSAQLLFNHMGRRIDLHLVYGPVPSVQTMADSESIGLCAIAVGTDGQVLVLASPRYINSRPASKSSAAARGESKRKPIRPHW